MTALLYLIVIAMWAVVLVPIWLKGHDNAQLEKKLAALGEAAPKWRMRQREELTSGQRAFVRRRRTMMGLLTAVIASILLSASGVIPVFFVALPVTVLAVFVAAAIRKVRVDASRGVRTVQVRTAQRTTSAPQQAQTPTSSTTQTQVTEPVNPRAWRPSEAYVPGYVTAPRATAQPRVLDSQKPWTADDMLEQAAVMRAARNARVKETQLRLEEARAIAMEKSRKAALAAADRQAQMQQGNVDPQQKAAGE